MSMAITKITKAVQKKRKSRYLFWKTSKILQSGSFLGQYSYWWKDIDVSVNVPNFFGKKGNFINCMSKILKPVLITCLLSGFNSNFIRASSFLQFRMYGIPHPTPTAHMVRKREMWWFSRDKYPDRPGMLHADQHESTSAKSAHLDKSRDLSLDIKNVERYVCFAYFSPFISWNWSSAGADSYFSYR